METSPIPEAGDVVDASAPALSSAEASSEKVDSSSAVPSDSSAPTAAEAIPEAPAPTTPEPPPLPPELLSPDAWAASKNLPAWQLEVTRAFHLASTDHALRVAWLPNGRLSESDFDAALHRALHASLR